MILWFNLNDQIALDRTERKHKIDLAEPSYKILKLDDDDVERDFMDIRRFIN